MNSGFLEFGLQALIGYGFMITYTVWYFSTTTETPPGCEATRPDFKKTEEGISMDGATLVIPKIKEEVLVGV